MRSEKDRGAVAIVVVLFVLIAMILLAFVIDRGRIYVARAELQNAVDSAALAAAQTFCGGTGDPFTIAQQYAAANNAPVDPAQVVISTGSSSYVNVQASRPLAMAFAPFADTENVAVAAQATAVKSCNNGYAVFAGEYGFEDNGGMTVTGSIYSDGDVKITSNANSIVDGQIDYSSDCNGCNKANLPDGSATPTQGGLPSKTPRCFAYEIGLDRPVPNTTGCTGDDSNTGALQSLTWTTTCPANLNAAWFAANPTVMALDCSGDIDISAWDNSTALVAVKSAGQITITSSFGSGNPVGNSTKAVVLYSESSSRGVEIKGNDQLTIYGYLYVPVGEVYVGGNANLSWTGSVIAEDIRINGTGSGGGTVGFLALDPVVRLVQ